MGTIPKTLGLLYLACPYSHDDPAVREARFEAANRRAVELTREGVHVFSPITHSHPLCKYGLPGDWSFWALRDRWFLDRCAWMEVLAIDGWKTSRGVQEEILIVAAQDKPITYHTPD